MTRGRMENEDDQQERDDRAETQETSEQSRRMKLRDLNPEKDPMGAGDKLRPNE
ncbi:MAG: hypothetical protein ACJ8KX_02500 [Chthoniobacterales bacterium]